MSQPQILNSDLSVNDNIQNREPTKSSTLVHTNNTSRTSLSSSSSEVAQPSSKEKWRRLSITHILPPETTKLHWLHQLRHTIFTVYRRLFALIVITNIMGLLVMLRKPTTFEEKIVAITSASSSNLFVAIIMRQEYFINFLFAIGVGCTPVWLPLRFRRITSKLYEFGGVHSGTAVCSVLWFIGLTGLLTWGFAERLLQDIPTLTLCYLLLLLFIGIITFAHPELRRRAHNTFERSHRFAGWTSLGVFWCILCLSARALAAHEGESRTTGIILVKLPAFWLLTFTSLHIIYPWLHLRKVEITPEVLSDHAIRLHLGREARVPGPFYTIRISDSPLSEWHSFAVFDDARPINGSIDSIIVSRAGDWTSKTIAEPKTTYWTRGIPTLGVLYMAPLFHSVVVITTGSGIGPCLSLLSLPRSKRPECRVFWSAPSPLETFGQEVVDLAQGDDPMNVIWDTRVLGRPDMVAVTWQLMMESGAEAAFVISNPKVTREVVYGLESRGVAAYGPVFDS